MFPGALHAVPAPVKARFAPVQFAARVSVHDDPQQHAPVPPHGFGEHDPPGPCQVVLGIPAQNACVCMEQKPLALLQQAPVGCGHGFGEHAEPTACNVPP